MGVLDTAAAADQYGSTWTHETKRRTRSRWHIMVRQVAISTLVVSLFIIVLTLTIGHDDMLRTITIWPPAPPSPPKTPSRKLQFTQSSSASSSSSSSPPTLKISIFSDLHFGEAESTGWGPEQDVRTLEVMTTILDRESPDLVVLNGDLITGDDTQLENATAYFDRLVAPMVQRDVPWASAYGNHDNHFNLSTAGILDRERGYYDLSMTEKMVTGGGEQVGISNYFVPLYRIGGGDGPVAILWFFDSRGGLAFHRKGEDGNMVQLPGTVDPSVTEWFVRTSRNLRRQHGRGSPIPSLAFVHIPVSAMRAFQDETGVDEHREPGINDDVPLEGQVGDEAFLTALEEEGVAAVFSGHDHGNDWCMPTEKKGNKGNKGRTTAMFACFGRHTGYGGYGRWMRGSRQILLTPDGELETWIRLEDGRVSGHVTLNATYGTDVYPAARKAFTSLGAREAR